MRFSPTVYESGVVSQFVALDPEPVAVAPAKYASASESSLLPPSSVPRMVTPIGPNPRTPTPSGRVVPGGDASIVEEILQEAEDTDREKDERYGEPGG